MATDPVDPDQGTGLEGDGEEGTPTPSEAEALRAENATLKQENAKLREGRRQDRARALGAEHQLTPTQVELLQLVPADQMEDKAKALAAEQVRAPGGPPASGEAPPQETPPPDEGPGAETFERTPGTPVTDPALSWQDELNQRIAKAKDMAEIADIQREFKERQRRAAEG